MRLLDSYERRLKPDQMRVHDLMEASKGDPAVFKAQLRENMISGPGCIRPAAGASRLLHSRERKRLALDAIHELVILGGAYSAFEVMTSFRLRHGQVNGTIVNAAVQLLNPSGRNRMRRLRYAIDACQIFTATARGLPRDERRSLEAAALAAVEYALEKGRLELASLARRTFSVPIEKARLKAILIFQERLQKGHYAFNPGLMKRDFGVPREALLPITLDYIDKLVQEAASCSIRNDEEGGSESLRKARLLWSGMSVKRLEWDHYRSGKQLSLTL